jgi:nitrite reductase/ring-hydroxylating ferredoxin subunit
MVRNDESSAPEAPLVEVELRGLRDRAASVRDLGEGQQCVLVRRGDKVTGFREICPHMGGPLGEGIVCQDGTIQCPWHGYRYDLDTGELRDNPNAKTFAILRGTYSSWKPETAPRYRLAMLDVTVDGGRVRVRRRGGGAP